MSERGNAARTAPPDANRELAPRAWCPACNRRQPCARHLGTTDWQTTPVYTCLACGQVIHEATLAPLGAAPDAPVTAP